MGLPTKVLTAGVLALGACWASAAPVIQSTSFYTDRWAPSVAFPTVSGDYLHLFTTVVSADPASQVSAVATQGALVRPLDFFTGPIFAEKNFERLLTNTTLIGGWNLVATDSSGSANGFFAPIVEPEFLPLMQNVQVLGTGTTPTVTWQLPSFSGFDPERIRVRAVIAATGVQIFQSAVLPTTTTSFTFADGLLQQGTGYVFRILLEDIESAGLENRSNTFSGVYAPVPEPQSWALLLAGVLALAAFPIRRRAAARPARRELR
jgi:hypothetical protein